MDADCTALHSIQGLSVQAQTEILGCRRGGKPPLTVSGPVPAISARNYTSRVQSVFFHIFLLTYALGNTLSSSLGAVT